MIGRLNHVAIAVPDLAAASQLYKGTLGAVVGAPAYPTYYTQPYYPPIAIQFGFGYWGSSRYRH